MRAGRVKQVCDVIREQIAGMRAGDFSDAELERARNMVVAGELDRLQSPGELAARMGVDEVVGLGAADWAAFLEEVRGVTCEAVIAAARQYLRRATIVVATPNPKAAESLLG